MHTKQWVYLANARKQQHVAGLVRLIVERGGKRFRRGDFAELFELVVAAVFEFLFRNGGQNALFLENAEECVIKVFSR